MDNQLFVIGRDNGYSRRQLAECLSMVPAVHGMVLVRSGSVTSSQHVDENNYGITSRVLPSNGVELFQIELKWEDTWIGVALGVIHERITALFKR